MARTKLYTVMFGALFAMATAQADLGPARHEGRKGPSQMSHHAEDATQAADRAILTLA